MLGPEDLGTPKTSQAVGETGLCLRADVNDLPQNGRKERVSYLDESLCSSRVTRTVMQFQDCAGARGFGHSDDFFLMTWYHRW